jgi:hypothetical protein
VGSQVMVYPNHLIRFRSPTPDPPPFPAMNSTRTAARSLADALDRRITHATGRLSASSQLAHQPCRSRRGFCLQAEGRRHEAAGGPGHAVLGRVAYDGKYLVGYGTGSASNCGKSRSAAAPNATQSKRPPIRVPTTELASARYCGVCTTHRSFAFPPPVK